ncbi:MAG: hypothetical protein PUF37_04835 [Prevotellaceae bacterium]|nr:hypothetical protein [Prevotella sp.]MDD6552895.1 hypothetical protein [Prevotellaceae bacterium]
MMKLFVLAALALLPMGMQAQKLHESASLETSHLWRGLEVGNGLILNNDVSVSDNNNHFKIGLWGGMATDGDYKEADVYMNYNNSGFNLAVWDLWNFSEGIPGNGKYFTWAADRTSHLLDAAISYDFGVKCNFPLTLSWATLLVGRDRGVANEQNVYSTFVQAAYRIYDSKDWAVDASVGGAFALNPYDKDKYPGEQNNLYGKSAGVVDCRLGATYKLKIGKWNMPVTGQMMWNPEASKAYFRASVNLLDL